MCTLVANPVGSRVSRARARARVHKGYKKTHQAGAGRAVRIGCLSTAYFMIDAC
jgi:hypothetical protein